MKKIILMLVIAFSFVACKKDNPNKVALVIESGDSDGVTLIIIDGEYSGKLDEFTECSDGREFLTFKADKGDRIKITNDGSKSIKYSIRVGSCDDEKYKNIGGHVSGGEKSSPIPM